MSNFEQGKVYKSKDGKRLAVCDGTRSGGKEGLLRCIDDSHQEWVLWSDGKWQLKEPDATS